MIGFVVTADLMGQRKMSKKMFYAQLDVILRLYNHDENVCIASCLITSVLLTCRHIAARQNHKQCVR